MTSIRLYTMLGLLDATIGESFRRHVKCDYALSDTHRLLICTLVDTVLDVASPGTRSQ
jgi:hypothetical protein